MKIAIQIHKDGLDGQINAGALGKSVDSILKAFTTHAALPAGPRIGGDRAHRKPSARRSNDWDDLILGHKFLAIQRHLEGNEYCAYLSKHGIHPNFAWLKLGCPKTYTEAYKIKRWKRLIHQEKSRVNAKMRNLDPVELERIMAIARSRVSVVSARD